MIVTIIVMSLLITLLVVFGARQVALSVIDNEQKPHEIPWGDGKDMSALMDLPAETREQFKTLREFEEWWDETHPDTEKQLEQLKRANEDLTEIVKQRGSALRDAQDDIDYLWEEINALQKENNRLKHGRPDSRHPNQFHWKDDLTEEQYHQLMKEMALRVAESVKTPGPYLELPQMTIAMPHPNLVAWDMKYGTFTPLQDPFELIEKRWEDEWDY